MTGLHPMHSADYRGTVLEMVRVLREFCTTSPAPRFAMPPDDVLLIVSLPRVKELVALDLSAAVLVEVFCMLEERFRDGRYPTLVMLRTALQMAEVPYERCPLSYFGEVGQMAPGGEA